MNLWVFGHSACLSTGLHNQLGWVDLLVKECRLQACHNFAAEAVDNFYIYHSLLKNLKGIQPNDTVIIGWSHPSRKTFILDRANPHHTQQLKQGALVYDGDPEFFRSTGAKPDNTTKWKNMLPQRQGNQYFDRWFEDYYSEIETVTNFSSYLAAAEHLIPCRYVPFYFSRHSVKDIDVDPSSLFWLDFIMENRVWISESDSHPNERGHRMIADFFIKKWGKTVKTEEQPLTTA